MRWNANNLITHNPSEMHWIGRTDRLWYRQRTARGYEFVLVDAGSHTQGDAFNQARVAQWLSALSGCPIESGKLALSSIEVDNAGRHISFFVDLDCGSHHTKGWYQLDRRRGVVAAAVQPLATQRQISVSSDGRHAAFIEAFNLSSATWLRIAIPRSPGTERMPQHRRSVAASEPEDRRPAKSTGSGLRTRAFS